MTRLWERLERATQLAPAENATILSRLLSDASAFAAGLVALGVVERDRVAIYADDGPDWLVADLGAQRIGCGVIAIPPALSSGSLAQILEQLSPAVLVTRAPHGLSTVTSLLRAQRACGSLRLVVVLSGRDIGDRVNGERAGSEWSSSERSSSERVLGESAGADRDGAATIEALSRALIGSSEASHIVSAEALLQLGAGGYTGPVQRGGELVGFSAATRGTLRAATWSRNAVANQLDRLTDLELKATDVVWSDLGLAHPMGRLVAYRTLVDGAGLTLLSGDARVVVPKVEPSYLFGVPRTFEALFAACAIDSERAGGLPRRLFRWAQSLGDDMSYVYEGRYEPDVVLRIRHRLTRRLVAPRIAVHLGHRLERAMCATGAISHDILRFFHGLGVNVGQSYGTLAIAPVTHLVPPSRARFDGTFPPVSGVEARVVDGRLWLSAPDLAPSAVVAIDASAHSPPPSSPPPSSPPPSSPPGTDSTAGEAFEWDGHGRFVDTEDLAEVRDAATLKRVRRCARVDGEGPPAQRALASVAELEAELTASPYLSRAFVTGTGGPFLCALVTLDSVAIATFARERGIVARRASELARRPEIYALVNSIVASVSASRPAFEAIRKFAVLDGDFAYPTGELTPFGGLCRDEVARRHAALIASFYSETY